MRYLTAVLLAALAAAFPSAALADDAPACLAAKGPAPQGRSVRGVNVGTRAVIRTADGAALHPTSISYCVTGGGDFSLALTQQSDVVLVTSTAVGDSIGPINPTSPALSARMAFPKMRKLVRTDKTTVYRVDNRRQLLIGVSGGRVSFVAAADRLLLDYPHKLGYYVKRLAF